MLGSGGWLPTGRRETTCFLVRRGSEAVVLDAGTGLRRLVTTPALLAGVEALDLVLTHFHLDHICGLLYLPALPLWSRDPPPLRVWGPGRWLLGAPTARLLEPLLRPPLSPFPRPVVADVHELAPGAQEIGPFSVRALEQRRHWGPTAALRLDDALALITDTGRDERHAELAAGVEQLLHEAWSTSAAPIFSDRDATAADAGRTARAAGVGGLTLIHLNPLVDAGALLADARRAFPAARLGEDGERFTTLACGSG